MAFAEWDETFSCHIEAVDADHKHLLDLLNGFHEAYRAGKGKEEILGLLRELIKYAEEHFQREERLMDQSGYLDLLEHQIVHEELVTKVFELHEKYASGDAHISDEVMEFLRLWLVEHILHMDKKFGDWYQQR
jgi:hemerythrin